MGVDSTIADVLEGRARWCVVCADCLDVLPTIPRVDAVVTDPPYGIGADKAKYTGVMAAQRDYYDTSWDDDPIAQSTVDAIRSVSRWQIVFGGNYYAMPPSSCWLVWDKLNGANNFADCELAWTNLPRAVRRIAWRWHGMIRQGNEPRWHPTQKPEGVMQWAIGWLPDDAETILDPFCGSGTTGVACLRLGRRFIGIEKEPKYAAIARERLAAEERGSTLQASRAGQESLFGRTP